MDSLEKLCLGCMRKKENTGICPYCGFDLENYEVLSHQLRPQTILNGKYFIGKKLGEGGFGITYIAWDLNLEIALAIKEYFPSGFVTRDCDRTDTVSVFSGDRMQYYRRGKERFLEEARILAKFYDMEGIVSVKDFFSENGTAYIVMEYIDGEDFGDFLKRNGGKLPVDNVLEMMKPVMKALIAVHEKGLIHRDISPDNIMITKDSKIKLLDFGAAREASNGEKSLSVMLKPGYAPEEQYRTRGEQGAWTDVYALCATIYRAITGVKPIESLDRMAKDELKMPSQCGVSIRPEQEYAIMKGMAVLSSNRWKSVQELYQALYEGKKNGKNQYNNINRNISNVDPTIFDPTPPSAYDRGNQNSLSGSYRYRQPQRASSTQPIIIGLLVALIGLVGIGGVMAFQLFSSPTASSDSPYESRVEEETQTVEEETVTTTEGTTEAEATTEAAEPEYEEPVYEEPREEESYILPGSDSRYLSYSDISGLSSWEIKLAKNEIYARHGRRFHNSEIQNYFDRQSWYSGTISPGNDSIIENSFNSYEKENIKFLSKYE